MIKLRPAVALTAIWLAGAAMPVHAQDAEAPLEVIHGYTTESEVAALKVIVDQFEKEGGKWVDSAIAPPAKARANTVTRVVGGNPPGAAQNQVQMVFRELLDEGLLSNVTELAKQEKWLDVLPKGVVDDMTYNGEIVYVPIQTQTQTWTYFSKPVLDKAGATAPTTWDELFPVLDKIKAAGLVPLAMANEKNHIRRTFMAILSGSAGPDVYNQVFVEMKPESVKTEGFRKAAEIFGKLRAYGDPGQSGRQWQDATNMLITGRAGVQIMGDWAQGEWTAAGKEPDKDYVCTFLGNVAVLSGNAVIFPKIDDAGVVKAQQHLAKVLMEPDVQLEFAKKKGTIPTRTDVDTSSLNSCSQLAVKLIADPKTSVRDDTYTVSPARLGAWQDLAVQFWNTPDMTVDQFVDRFGQILSAQM